MAQKLYESYSWLRDDLKYAGPKGSKAQFKGVALRPVISGNGKKYVDEELHRAARTLVGKPVTLNHNMQKIKGDVTWAEYEDGNIEYVMEISDREYVQKLQDKFRMPANEYIKKWSREPIYGVSVEANYRYHQENKNAIEPHGIIFNALSIVEDPEKPGVAGTSIELMEMQQQTELRLVEALVHDFVPANITVTVGEKKKMVKPDKSEEKTITETIAKLPIAEAKLKLGEPFAGYDNFEQCVAQNSDKDNPEAYCATIKRQTEETITYRRSVAERVNGLIDAETALSQKIMEVTVTIAELPRKEDVTQAVTQAVTDLKNAMETSSKTLAEKLGQTVQKAEFAEALNKLPDIDEKIKPLQDAISKLPNVDEKLKPLQDAISKLPNIDEILKPLQEKVSKQIVMVDVEKIVQDALAKQPNVSELLKPLNEALAKIPQLETKITEQNQKYAMLNTVYEALNKNYQEKVKEIEANKLKETLDAENKLKDYETKIREMQDELDTVKKHIPPNFQAKQPAPEKQDYVNQAPYSY